MSAVPSTPTGENATPKRSVPVDIRITKSEQSTWLIQVTARVRESGKPARAYAEVEHKHEVQDSIARLLEEVGC